MENDQFFLRSPDQMYEKFPGLEHAVARSQEIADSVDIDLELGKYYFPKFECPDQKEPIDYLRELCIKGLKERYADDPERLVDGELSDEVMARLDRELDVIEKLGYPTYFLIVWDFVHHARSKGISATARGSGVGAIVCYALYLSHVCPLRYDLLFERFLDESRTEPPDIDIDFEKERRGEVIDYVKERYGSEMVCQIGTFGTLAARAAIKDTGRALGVPLARVNQITEMVPDELKITIKKALEKSAELKMEYDGDPEVRELLDLAMKIEGLARNVGTHAAAVVIADQPLTEYVPLGRVPGKQDVITQWSMGDVEASGLLKMDFLGLRNLTILSRTVQLIEQTTGKAVDPLKFPLDDKETYALLQRGETKGVFQLESGGIRDLLLRMKPDHFTDIIATAALYRPGPLEGGMVDDYVNIKHGRQQPEYKHPVLKDILEETNSIMVYQEQVMRILNRLGKIPLANAYTCIKAISKKKESLINQNHEAFIKGCVDNGLAEKDAEDIWNLIVKFAGYGFNKSHSTAYALVAYQTAYLKAHYPVEFMAALLSSDISGRNFKRKDCAGRAHGGLRPDGDRSGRARRELQRRRFLRRRWQDSLRAFGDQRLRRRDIDFDRAGTQEERPLQGHLRFLRTGRYRRLQQECHRNPDQSRRDGLLWCQAQPVDRGHRTSRPGRRGGPSGQEKRPGESVRRVRGRGARAGEQGSSTPLPDMEEWPEREKLLAEKEVLGFYLASHPLAEFESKLATFRTHTTDRLADVKDRGEVVLGGMISSIKFAHTKNAKPGTPTKYANFDLEDMQGSIRCIVWPKNFVDCGDRVQPDAVVLAKGKIDRRGGDEANLIIDELIPLKDLDTRYTHGMRIRLSEQDHDANTMSRLREIIRGYPGSQELLFSMQLERRRNGASQERQVPRRDHARTAKPN